jgi:hypothetical protein
VIQEEGLAFTEVLYGEYITIFSERTTKSRSNKGFRGKQRLLLDLDAPLITALALNAGITALCHENQNLSSALRQLGLAAFNECCGYSFGQYNEKEAKRIEALAKAKNSSLKQRRAALSAYAKKLTDFKFEPWTDAEKMQAGRWLLEGLIEGPAFCLDTNNRLSLTEDALSQLDDVTAAIVMKRLVGIPVTEELPNWEKSVLYIDNLPYNLIRSFQKPVRHQRR